MARKRVNRVDKEWRRLLKDQLNGNMLMDTPMGKTVFAAGVCFVLNWLEKQGKYPEELDTIYDDVVEFTDAYMAESVLRRAEHKRLQEMFGDPDD